MDRRVTIYYRPHDPLGMFRPLARCENFATYEDAALTLATHDELELPVLFFTLAGLDIDVRSFRTRKFPLGSYRILTPELCITIPNAVGVKGQDVLVAAGGCIETPLGEQDREN
jgi:hypothetical protein